MRCSLWTLCILAVLGAYRGDEQKKEEKKKNVGPKELLCVDDVRLFFVSPAPDKEVTLNPKDYRLRILRLLDGNLLLYVNKELAYPFDPLFTPFYLSEEESTILLPDLEKEGAAIGLKLPPDLFEVIHELLHETPPPENVVKVLSRADEIAEMLLKKAEEVQIRITKKAEEMQEGDPAAPTGAHPVLGAIARYLALGTAKVQGFTSAAADLLGSAIDKVEQILKSILPKWLTFGKGNDETENKHRNHLRTGGMTSATVEAMDTIIEALQTSALILAKSLKEQSVKVVQHKYGEDVATAMADLIKAVENTWNTFDNLDDVNLEGIAGAAVGKVIDNIHGAPVEKKPLGKCTEKKEL